MITIIMVIVSICLAVKIWKRQDYEMGVLKELEKRIKEKKNETIIKRVRYDKGK